MSSAPRISDILRSIADFAPLSLQESWDNSGVQVGGLEGICTGAMLCVDCTPAVIAEAAAKGCNLVIAHHPLLFKGLKRISPGDNVVQQTVIDAIRAGITVYSSHTALDSASGGISQRMARMLGATPLHAIDARDERGETGLGVIAEFAEPLSHVQLVERVKQAFGSAVVRASGAPEEPVKRIGMCGGAGGEFIPRAIAEGCQAYLTSDTRYHDFVDYGQRIFMLDIGHFESESCSKQIFYDVISEFFPNFAVYKSEQERNSINYL